MKFCPECGQRLAISGYCSGCNIQYGEGQGQGTRQQRAEFQIFKDFEFEPMPDGTIFLKRCKNTTLDSVVIPPEVSALGEHCFSECKKLTSVVFEGKMERIPRGAFCGCSALEEITWPQGLATIEGWAFRECIALEEITIPDGVYCIGNEAFFGCSALDTVSVPPSLMRVEVDAFAECFDLFEVNISDLAAWCEICFENEKASPLCAQGDLCLNGEEIEELRIPEGVYTLKEFAFLNCDLIESVHLPASLGLISPLAFYHCCGIEKITVAKGNSSFRTVEGGRFLLCKNDLVLAAADVEELPDCIERVRAGAFSTGTDIVNLEIGDTVRLQSSAFVGLEGIEMLTAPVDCLSLHILFTYECRGYRVGRVPSYFDTLELYGTGAFEGNMLGECKRIDTLRLKEGYSSIGKLELCCVEEISTLILPKSLTEIGAVGTTFNRVKHFTIAPGGCFEMQDGCLVHAAKRFLIASFQSTKIPSDVRGIAPYAFFGNERIRELYIGNHVTTVKKKAFANCPNLERVTIGPSVCEIYCDAFLGDNKLQDIVMQEVHAWDKIPRFGREVRVAPKWDPGVPHWLRILTISYNPDYERIVRR